MRDLSEREVSDFVCERLEALGYELVLTNPTKEGVFPCIELHLPLKSVNRTYNAFPIRSAFQVSVTCWNAEQRKCMEMTHEVDGKLQEMNFTRTNTNPCIYDSIIKKYGITVMYEVRFNGLTDSFEFIR